VFVMFQAWPSQAGGAREKSSLLGADEKGYWIRTLLRQSTSNCIGGLKRLGNGESNVRFAGAKDDRTLVAHVLRGHSFGAPISEDHHSARFVEGAVPREIDRTAQVGPPRRIIDCILAAGKVAAIARQDHFRFGFLG